MVVREKLIVEYECVVTDRDGDTIFCSAYPLDGEPHPCNVEFWEMLIRGNDWHDGHVFYVIRGKSDQHQKVDLKDQDHPIMGKFKGDHWPRETASQPHVEDE